ncbi:MAG: hypothetical protein CSA65_08440 [Proteobacteria bacterium]|nr:MAG: hypothetical protein CSA65_08440 [Pseudomonadota bacterium]
MADQKAAQDQKVAQDQGEQVNDSSLADDGATQGGTPTTLTTNIKSMVSYVDLHTMKVHAQTDPEVKSGEIEFYTTHLAAKTPGLLLHSDVGAINLGAAKSYDQVVEAPATGYVKDDLQTGTYAVGKTWWTSKDEAKHVFVMSNNIYVLALPDGSFAKIQVMSAGSGKIVVRCFRQANGSRDLRTTSGG